MRAPTRFLNVLKILRDDNAMDLVSHNPAAVRKTCSPNSGDEGFASHISWYSSNIRSAAIQLSVFCLMTEYAAAWGSATALTSSEMLESLLNPPQPPRRDLARLPHVIESPQDGILPTPSPLV